MMTPLEKAVEAACRAYLKPRGIEWDALAPLDRFHLTESLTPVVFAGVAAYEEAKSADQPA